MLVWSARREKSQSSKLAWRHGRSAERCDWEDSLQLAQRTSVLITPFVSPHRIPSLDGLRAVSILMVILGHLCGARGNALAVFGVQVFFVISGYLITSLLQNEYERNGGISLSAFYNRRCFRIFPAAYAYILVAALAFPAARQGLVYALTYTVSYNRHAVASQLRHLWSLSIEEQFYLVWPLALVLFYRRRALIGWSVMIVAAAFRLIVALDLWHLHPDAIHFSPLGAMDSIAAGCLLAIFQTNVRKRIGWMSQHAAIVLAIPLTAWVLYINCFDGIATVVFGVVPLLLAISIFLLIERADWVLNNSLAVTVGVLSYSLYLWQEPFAVQASGPVGLRVAALVACAIASYLLVERPMLRLGAWVRFRKPATPSLVGKSQIAAAK
jgi:peptidoglycan/LPS O-acetylase OafA/YrhL